MKYILVIMLVAVVGILGWFGYTKFVAPKPTQTATESNEKVALTPVIEAVLTQKLKLLEELAQNTVLISAATAATKKNQALSQSEIKNLDAKWQASREGDPFVSQFLTNNVAKALISFQEENSGFVEIFVTDAVGLNIGQTNKTSDYLQGDEDWWTGAYNNGTGKAYHGEIEFDDSSRSESIALYVPVFSKQKTVIGVIKGVYNITAIQKEL